MTRIYAMLLLALLTLLMLFPSPFYYCFLCAHDSIRMYRNLIFSYEFYEP